MATVNNPNQNSPPISSCGLWLLDTLKCSGTWYSSIQPTHKCKCRPQIESNKMNHTAIPITWCWKLLLRPVTAFTFFLFIFAHICLFFCGRLFSIEHVIYFSLYIWFMFIFYMSHDMTHWLTRYDSHLTCTFSSLWLVLLDDSYFTMTHVSLWLIW